MEGTQHAVAAALGLDQDPTKVGTASVDKLSTIPSDARAVLAKNGITTITDLAAADSKKVATMMRAEGVAAGAGDAAGWSANARTLMRLGR